MKIQWSVFYSLSLLFTLWGCGSEQFGTTPKTNKSQASPVQNYSYKSCAESTLIKPKVDVIYFVDNSYSSVYIPQTLKNRISDSVNLISKQFDLRVINTPLLETSSGNNDYQVLDNSTELLGDSRRVSSVSEFNFQRTPVSGEEKGLQRVVSFMNQHKNSLIRSDAHHIVVLISNGRDMTIEKDRGTGNGETITDHDLFGVRFGELRAIKQSLNSLQLRLMSVTAKSVCVTGHRVARDSYQKMSRELYLDGLARDNDSFQDNYDLCNSNAFNDVFTGINSSIQQVTLPHKYRYWPIPFANNNQTVSIDSVVVTKVSPNGSTVTLVPTTDYTIASGPLRDVPTREQPSVGEVKTAEHFVRFNNLLTYPDCVLITSVSKTEYFGFVVLPQKPKVETVSVRINGRVIPKSTTNGWSDLTNTVLTRNIKVDCPTCNPPGEANPPQVKTGYMLQLNGSANYYKSGDNLEVNYIPAGI